MHPAADLSRWFRDAASLSAEVQYAG